MIELYIVYIIVGLIVYLLIGIIVAKLLTNINSNCIDEFNLIDIIIWVWPLELMAIFMTFIYEIYISFIKHIKKIKNGSR